MVEDTKLYWPSVSSPWKYAAAVSAAWASPGHTVGGLPGGEFRVERLREVRLGSESAGGAREAVVYALLYYPQDIHRALGIRPFTSKPAVSVAAGVQQ